MVNTQEFLLQFRKALQINQVLLSVGLSAVSSPHLKTSLQQQQAELDQIEHDLHLLATRRGIEQPELQPGTRWFLKVHFRQSLGKQDSSIAQKIFLHHVNGVTELMRSRNALEHPQMQMVGIFQKYLDYVTVSGRQLLIYL